ncbi:MAG: hypothetical protein OEW97_02920 [Gammaproteobacteria bacterium]|nr:hypothetical protein [Gammaproteobacteria bacterium]
MAPSMTQVSTPVTALQQRLLRERIYRQHTPVVNLMRGRNGKVLHPAPPTVRQSNFLKFVKIYFTGGNHPNNTKPSHDDFSLPNKLNSGSNGYKAFARFAQTDYGSYVIKEMLGNQSKYKGFKIQEGYTQGASADTDWIFLPKTFPSRKKFNGSFGQDIYDLAIIYHEFAHTRVFRSATTLKQLITINHERDAVLYFENPVRIMNGYEPRYTYTTRNQSHTINIITGIPGDGVLLVDKNNPKRLVSPSSKDALR